MAYDLGTFGSDGYYLAGDQHLFPLRDQIFSDVFNGSISMKQRDEMLINASGGISDRRFIAILEKTIATHADCIILLGMISSFVISSALTYYTLFIPPIHVLRLSRSALRIISLSNRLDSSLVIY